MKQLSPSPEAMAQALNLSVEEARGRLVRWSSLLRNQRISQLTAHRSSEKSGKSSKAARH